MILNHSITSQTRSVETIVETLFITKSCPPFDELGQISPVTKSGVRNKSTGIIFVAFSFPATCFVFFKVCEIIIIISWGLCSQSCKDSKTLKNLLVLWRTFFFFLSQQKNASELYEVETTCGKVCNKKQVSSEPKSNKIRSQTTYTT